MPAFRRIGNGIIIVSGLMSGIPINLESKLGGVILSLANTEGRRKGWGHRGHAQCSK